MRGILTRQKLVTSLTCLLFRMFEVEGLHQYLIPGPNYSSLNYAAYNYYFLIKTNKQKGA